MKPLPALESTETRYIRREHVGPVVRIKYIDTLTSIFLRPSVRGEDFDRVVDARGGNGWFIGVTCSQSTSESNLA